MQQIGTFEMSWYSKGSLGKVSYHDCTDINELATCKMTQYDPKWELFFCA